MLFLAGSAPTTHRPPPPSGYASSFPAASSAWSKSSVMSWMCSIPTLTRTRSCEIVEEDYLMKIDNDDDITDGTAAPTQCRHARPR